MHLRSGAARAVLAVVALAFPAAVATAAPLAPAPAVRESFEVGTLHVDRYGTGKRALILVPGLGAGSWSWYGTIADFSPSYDIYAVTLPGFDGRPAATAEPSLVDAFVRDLTRLIRERALAKPALVGHSLGGTLALAFAERAPALPGAVIAIDGLPVFPTLALADQDARTKAGEQAAAGVANADAASELASDKQYMARIGTVDPALVDPTAEREAKSDPHAVAAWLREDLANDFRPDLAKITAPVLEIVPYNAADRTQPPANYTLDQTLAFYRSLLPAVSDLTITPIPDARHFAMLDRPAAFYMVLRGFLDAKNIR